MDSPFRGDDYATVGDILVGGPSGIAADPTEWRRCGDARARSAVSRGYYAAFLLLKEKLCSARVDWSREERSFPRDGVHRKLLKAIANRLGETSQLHLLMRALLRGRKLADYELTRDIDLTDASDAMDQAWDVINAIHGLTGPDIEGLANELYDVDRGFLR